MDATYPSGQGSTETLSQIANDHGSVQTYEEVNLGRVGVRRYRHDLTVIDQPNRHHSRNLIEFQLSVPA